MGNGGSTSKEIGASLPEENMSTAEVSRRASQYVGMALGITSQDWSSLGMGTDPAVAASNDMEATVERVTALMLIRIIAWLQPRGTFSDLSTTTICRELLMSPSRWPESINEEIMDKLKAYVKEMLTGYQDVPYHNFEHCYHVTISTNKLMDMIFYQKPNEPRPYTYGFRDDPLMQFALLFSALVHDVEHKGIPNRQLALEDDELAIQYNDTSIAEHRSLFLGFRELLKPQYGQLKKVLFPSKDDYRRFREAVVNLVLTTDIASPERAQIGKSKWKEAFGDDYETVERKVLKQMERRASLASSARVMPKRGVNRRMSAQSIMSELTLESPVGIITPEDDLEDDESVSLSPDPSDDEEDEINKKSAPPLLQPSDGTGPVFRPPIKSAAEFGPPGRSKSTDSMGYKSPRLRKVRNQRVPDGSCSAPFENDIDANLTGLALKFHRRLSSIGPGSTGPASKRNRSTRLGLLRTVDLSGEALETYHKPSARLSATGATPSIGGDKTAKLPPAEEVDALRETVVMETIMKAADVAHNLQGWDLMAKWSNRLFLELKKAYVQGRGDDPQSGWFSNQIGFLEAYLLPLARKLDDMGVFGDITGSIFAQIVEENKERWMREGMSLTANIIREGHRIFPEEESDDDLGG